MLDCTRIEIYIRIHQVTEAIAFRSTMARIRAAKQRVALFNCEACIWPRDLPGVLPPSPSCPALLRARDSVLAPEKMRKVKSRGRF
jgi:hypothetical protein